MVRILSLSLFLFLVFTIYYDLTTGSLPPKTSEKKDTQLPDTAEPNMKSVRILVQPGDTVLSIHEHLLDGQDSPVSIVQLIHDFETLNPETKASQIKTGVIYQFPVYTP